MTYAPGNHLSRRSLLTSAAAMSAFFAAPVLNRPARSLAHRPAEQTSTPTSGVATLDEVLHAGLAAGLPGIALRVEHGDDVLYEGAAGFASLEQQTPVTPSDRFRVASVSKTFTAVLALQLVESGVMTLDDTVSQWLDDPVVARIPNVDQITLRHLLNHTSGVYDYFDDDSPFWQDAYFGAAADWERVWTPQEILAYADGDRHPPYFAPGEGFHYGNTSYILLGLMIEEAGGEPYADQLHSRILDPLGLTNTFLGATEAVPGGTTDAYQLIDGDLVNASTTHLSALGTAGGFVSTTGDLARFAGAIFGGELLDQATLAEMMTFVPTTYPGAEWGLGVMRYETTVGEIVGHAGDGPGAGARVFWLTEEEVTIVLLTNTGGADEIVEALFTLVIGALRGLHG